MRCCLNSESSFGDRLLLVTSFALRSRRSLCELSLELELCLVLSIAADAASFRRVGRNSQSRMLYVHRQDSSRQYNNVL